MSLHDFPTQAPPAFVTREELADMLRVSTKTVDRMKAKGMPYECWGRARTVYDPAKALAWAREQKRDAA